MHHRVWISRKQLAAGSPAVIHATFDSSADADQNAPGLRRTLEWHEVIELPAGARVVQDPDGVKGRKVWVEWQD